MGSSASLKDCMRALAVHSRKGKKPACKLIVCDHLPLTFVPINGELSEFVHRAVSVLNNVRSVYSYFEVDIDNYLSGSPFIILQYIYCNEVHVLVLNFSLLQNYLFSL